MRMNASFFSTYMPTASAAWNTQPEGPCPSVTLQHLVRIVKIVVGGIWELVTFPYHFFFPSSSQISGAENVDPKTTTQVEDVAEKAGVLSKDSIPPEPNSSTLPLPTSPSSEISSDQPDLDTAAAFSHLEKITVPSKDSISPEPNFSTLPPSISSSSEIFRGQPDLDTAAASSLLERIKDLETKFESIVPPAIDKAQILEVRMTILESVQESSKRETDREIAELKRELDYRSSSSSAEEFQMTDKAMRKFNSSRDLQEKAKSGSPFAKLLGSKGKEKERLPGTKKETPSE